MPINPLIFLILFICSTNKKFPSLSPREKVKEMFLHAYSGYLNNAYPADALNPLSCKAKYRSTHVANDPLKYNFGNFSLTLIDALDTLAVMNLTSLFEESLTKIIENISFDQDLFVSVFETNIRVLGGLLSGHVLATDFKKSRKCCEGYTGELLHLAIDLGNRLLPAFNTPTGIPYSYINLKTGESDTSKPITCTACAGTFILEFTTLSNLTGRPIFKETTARAMDYIWSMHVKGLVGMHIHVVTGKWTDKSTGWGSDYDSYYEYLYKMAMMTGEEIYKKRYNIHVTALKKHAGDYKNVHMDDTSVQIFNFVDSFAAFWPGLMTLDSDFEEAIRLFQKYYSVSNLYALMPDRFDFDGMIYNFEYHLRPELAESAYYLYKTTLDPYYREVNSEIMENIEKFTKTPCGFSSISNVLTLEQSDVMESFFLSETLKYLYLTFSEDDQIPFSVNDYVISTEGHFFPILNKTANPQKPDLSGLNIRKIRNSVDLSFIPPLQKKLARQVRERLRNLHLRSEGRHGDLLLSTYSISFELYKNIIFTLLYRDPHYINTWLRVISGEFPSMYSLFINSWITFLNPPTPMVVGRIVVADPIFGCESLKNVDQIEDNVVLVFRGMCSFQEKALYAQAAKASALIILDLSNDSKTCDAVVMSSDKSLPNVDIFVSILCSSIVPDFLVKLKNSKSGLVAIGEPDQVMNFEYDDFSEERSEMSLSLVPSPVSQMINSLFYCNWTLVRQFYEFMKYRCF